MIQTYSPDHYAIATSAAQDYEAFYEEEIRYRTMMGYPRQKIFWQCLYQAPMRRYWKQAAVI